MNAIKRENNTYINTLTHEVLNASEMLEFVQSETKRQYEECSGLLFDDIPIDEQQQMYIEQFEHQLQDMDWQVIFS
jgi:hypothetical protein